MKFLCNTYDPKRPDAKMTVHTMPHETIEHAWHWHMKWLSDKVIGEPMATAHYTVEQLKNMGLVGVYVRELE